MSVNKKQNLSLSQVNMITMGCSKNLVDTEQLAHQLKQGGYEVVFESPKPLAITIINTCGFILDAKNESIEKIFECVEWKNQGKINMLIVCGCLSARYQKELQEMIPEVDAFFPGNALQDILTFLNVKCRQDELIYRCVSTPKHYAYLKISEGCSHQCAFCAIPKIRGRQLSKPIEVLKKEAEILAAQGTKELLLVAQDLTNYGWDFDGKYHIEKLVETLAQVSGIKWIRMHYTYPNSFQLGLLDLMKKYDNICHYLDIPVQHINNQILQSMNRKITGEEIIALLDLIKAKVPDVALRTSLIVGFPGETKKMFNELKAFVSKGYFDRLGVFTYSHEENTPAYKLKDNVGKMEKQRRCEELMLIQQDISLAKNRAKIGQTIEVLVDEKKGKNYIGRTQYDSPEVDNLVTIKVPKRAVRIGDFCRCIVQKADCFDLEAQLIDM